MKVLVVGAGGREHALAWKLSRSPLITQVVSWPGGPGINAVAIPLGVAKEASFPAVIAEARRQGMAFVVVGPEKHLAEGFADQCRAADLPVFGPSQAGAMLEASKRFAKEMMALKNIPTAAYGVANDLASCRLLAYEMLRTKAGTVIKASGLAGGKGVFVCFNEEDVENALDRLFQSSMQEASSEIVVEEVLVGRECSFFAFVGQEGATPLGFAVDFKRLRDHDRGPNTGGMGCYSPVPWLPQDASEQVMQRVVEPLLAGLETRGITYSGCLYVGIMWGENGPSVVEFNVRLGDPEAQVLALQDQRDWGQLIAQKLGIVAAQDLGPLAATGRSVCVVLASGAYPYGEKPESHPTLGGDLFHAQKAESCVFGAALSGNDKEGYQVGSGRIMTVVAHGPSLEAARRTVYNKITGLVTQWPDVQYRRDIALRAMEEEKT